MPRREPSNMRPCLTKLNEEQGIEKGGAKYRHVVIGIFGVASAAKLNERVTAIVEEC